MICYLDTSALVKLLLRDEPDGDVVRTLWEGADVVVTSRIAQPEARAALSAARRAERLSARMLTLAKLDLARALHSMAIVELDPRLADVAGDVAERFGLRAYVAVHLASAIAIDDGSLVVTTWDRELGAAAARAGLAAAPGPDER